jgi:Tfp pilus assembly protein PilF
VAGPPPTTNPVADSGESAAAARRREAARHVLLGDGLLRDGKVKEAIAEYTQAIHADREYAPAYRRRAAAHEKNGDVIKHGSDKATAEALERRRRARE